MQPGSKKKHKFDLKEVQAVASYMKNLNRLEIYRCQIDIQIVKTLLSECGQLRSLILEDCEGFSNDLIEILCILAPQLEELRLGSSELEFDRNLTYEGLETFTKYKMNLKVYSV